MDRRFRSIRSLRSLDLLNSTRKEEESFLDLASDGIKTLCSPFLLEHSKWESVMNVMNREMEKGLAEGEEQSELKMLNTFVKSIPTKINCGDYLSVDFKGRYYKVMLTSMSNDKDKVEIDETLYTIPKKIRAETKPEAVFSFIADTIHDFLVIRGLQNQSFDLAFCFNFPVQMFSISKAHLISWAKEFGCDSVIGQDVCGLLQQALNALSLKVKISAVFNDTVGVLAACAAKDPECGIGLIVSAGTNCCYFERGSRIQKPFAKFACGQELVINTEWGGFGDSGTLQQFMTKYDKEIDAATLTPGKQIFEKMVATLYIGELARLLIVEAASKKLLFNGEIPEKLTHMNSFASQFLFDIDRDPPHIYVSTEVVLRERFKLNLIRRSDAVGVRYICRAVVTRSANLLGAACACLINRMGRRRVTIAVDGAFFRFSSTFPAILVETITQLIPYTYTFKLKLVDDATGKGGAAIIAACKKAIPMQPRFTILG